MPFFLKLLWAATYKYVTGATPLNRRERDQPPPDGTFEVDHSGEHWAFDRHGNRTLKGRTNESITTEE